MKALFVTALCLLVGAANAGDKKFEKTFDVSSGGTLKIKTDIGTIRITGSKTKQVSIVASVWGNDDEVERFEFDAVQTSSGVEISGKLNRGRWFKWSSHIGADFVISVPLDYDLLMETSGGNLEVTDLRGRVDGETSGGNISLQNIAGNITVGTSGGNLKAEKITGNLRMETSGGNVRIAEVLGDVEASTSGGHIKVYEVEGKVNVSTSGGHIDVSVKNKHHGIQAETSGGTITISVPRNIAANLDLSTSGGEVDCRMPIMIEGKISESKVRGTKWRGDEVREGTITDVPWPVRPGRSAHYRVAQVAELVDTLKRNRG